MKLSRSASVLFWLSLASHNLLSQSVGGKVGDAAAAVPDSTGPVVYTFCFTMDTGKIYVSDVFAIHGQTPGQTTPQYRGAYLRPKYTDPFKQMVDIKYGFAFATQTNYGCEDGVANQAQEEARKKSFVTPSAGTRNQVIETSWGGTNRGVIAASETTPAGTNQRELDRLLAKERDNFAPFCTATRLFMQNLDCVCFADHMTAARGRQTNSTGGGGATLMPKMAELYPQANLAGCTSREKLETAAANNLKSFSMSPEKKQALMSCVPAKVATLVLAQPDALFQINRYNGDTMTALTQCSAGH